MFIIDENDDIIILIKKLLIEIRNLRLKNEFINIINVNNKISYNNIINYISDYIQKENKNYIKVKDKLYYF